MPAVSINRLTEIVLAILAVIWGVILMLPGDLFSGIERYKYFSQFAPDTLWGAVMAVCGLVIVFPLPVRMRQYAHWILCTVWAGMTVLSLLSIISPPSLLITSLLATISFIHASKYWRLAYPPVVLP